MRLGMIHPLEPGVIAQFAENLDYIIVVEEKRPLIELGLKDVLYGTAGAPMIYGKRNPDGNNMFPADGELDTEAIADQLRPVLERFEPYRHPSRGFSADGGDLSACRC